jgi:hypothetical protein
MSRKPRLLAICSLAALERSADHVSDGMQGIERVLCLWVNDSTRRECGKKKNAHKPGRRTELVERLECGLPQRWLQHCMLDKALGNGALSFRCAQVQVLLQVRQKPLRARSEHLNPNANSPNRTTHLPLCLNVIDVCRGCTAAPACRMREGKREHGLVCGVFLPVCSRCCVIFELIRQFYIWPNAQTGRSTSSHLILFKNYHDIDA